MEPLFKEKNRNYEALSQKAKQRERVKDQKVEFIKRIKDALAQLKMIRENRLHEISAFFGFDNVWDLEKYNFKEAGDFTGGFEELLKIREKEGYLELSEREVLDEIINISN